MGRTADGFEIFLLCLQFLILINRNTLLRGKYRGNSHIYAEIHGEISLKALGDHLAEPKGIGDSLGDAQRRLETFSAMLTE